MEKRAQSKDWRLNLQFEFTGRFTLQQNHLAELAFSTLGNRGHTMMHKANLTFAMGYKIFPKAFKTATLLYGLGVVEIKGVKKS
eukprot:6719343-Ditylum_brightwellii.AAC.1